MSAPTLKGGNAPMDDLTATRLCAEAMGLTDLYPITEVAPILKDDTPRSALAEKSWPDDEDALFYDPLNDYAQCFALVKRLCLNIDFCGYAPPYPSGDSIWEITHNDGEQVTIRRDADLNRAIVFCVAAMQAAK